MTAQTEAQLASNLYTALAKLHDLETFRTAHQENVSVVWRDATVSNSAASNLAMTQAVNTIVADNLQDLFATAVARQRETVGAARKALLDLQFRADTPSPYTIKEASAVGAAVTAHDLTDDEINRIGVAEDAVDATLANGAAIDFDGDAHADQMAGTED